MGAIKKEVVKGSLNGKNSIFTVELVEVNDGYEVNYGDNKGWGIGYKNFENCSNLEEAAEAYYNLINLIQL